MRVQKHCRRLGLYSLREYQGWCRHRGFPAELRKSWDELEREWNAHCREIAMAQDRLKVDRDPAKLLCNVCSGARRAEDIGRPRWRALALRIEGAGLGARQRLALRALLEAAARRGRMLLREESIGGERAPLLDGLIELSRASRTWRRAPADWRPRTHNPRRQFSSLARHLVSDYGVPEFLEEKGADRRRYTGGWV